MPPNRVQLVTTAVPRATCAQLPPRPPATAGTPPPTPPVVTTIPPLPPPVCLRTGARYYDMVTGGGLCDPSRCDPSKLPAGKLAFLALGIMEFAKKHGLPEKLRDAVLHTSKRNSFPDGSLDEGRR